jgi:hydrogenase maturation protease
VSRRPSYGEFHSQGVAWYAPWELCVLGSMDERREGRILVLGVGNLLLGDEGVGIHAVRRLGEQSLPPHVDLLDGGTAGVDLLGFMSGYEKVVIIDAVDAGEEPGTIFRFTPQDVASGSAGLALSLHQTEVLEVLKLGSYVGQDLPPVVVLGVQPAAMDWSTSLSPTVERQMESLLDAVRLEMSPDDKSE